MNEQYLLDRIIKDAKAEAKKIISLAKENAAGNIAYAKQQAEQKITQAQTAAQKVTQRDIDTAQAAADIKNRIEMLNKKHEIVNQLFDDVKKEIIKANSTQLVTSLKKKYARPGDTVTLHDGGIVIANQNYELRLTLDELLSALRTDIEAEVTRILFA